MSLLFRVRFEGGASSIDVVGEGRYVVTTEAGIVPGLLDTDERPAMIPKYATTFERALDLVGGWEQAAPAYVDPVVTDCITAALVSNDNRKSSGWQRWLKTGQLQG